MKSTQSTSALKLYIGRKFTGVTVERDEQWPDMWRIYMGDRKSDMVNLVRAKDAAIIWARPRGLGGNEIVKFEQSGNGRAPGRGALESSRGTLHA